ncbi:MAG TPA: hypothetical protein VFD89_03795 [Clostridia bacterium]|nr:hypothetical protein [Clostridia bacterium]
MPKIGTYFSIALAMLFSAMAFNAYCSNAHQVPPVHPKCIILIDTIGSGML